MSDILKSHPLIPSFEKYHLDNGMTVLLQNDPNTKLVAVCLLYKVGSRDEHETQTGIAHLFEHLMFSNCGPGIDFDEILQNAGGDCNAFTTTDTTQYYSIAPYGQLERILALESRRISGFHVSKKDFKTQQRVVVEEFGESYLNNPYGLFTHQIMDMAYKKHPYRWPVIGLSPSHIENLRYEDVSAFYHSYYHPGNAILVISGNLEQTNVRNLVEKYFGDIRQGPLIERSYPHEPKMEAIRSHTVHKEIPEEGFYYAFPYCGRMDPDFYAVDFLTDILAEGKSSLLFSKLKKEKMICTSIDCYITSTVDPGLILVEAKINPDHRIEEAEEEFWSIIRELKQRPIDQHNWDKYMNKNESAYLFSQLGLMNQALNLSYAEWLGKPDLVYDEFDNYKKLDKEQIQLTAQRYFPEDSYCQLYYRSV